MFRVFLINFGWFLNTAQPTLDAAIAYAKRSGFEATIYNPHDAMVASWSPIGGLRMY